MTAVARPSPEAADLCAGGLTITSVAAIHTRVGPFDEITFTVGGDSNVHIALIRGVVAGGDVLARVHSECVTGDVFGSRKCDCGEQLAAAMEAVANSGRGVIVYLRGHEGRGIGLINKLKAYALQEQGLDTVDANVALGLPVDARDYRAAAIILRYLRVRSVALLTNNPDKVAHLRDSGVSCARTVAMPSTVHRHNARYLETKIARLGHSGLGAPRRALG